MALWHQFYLRLRRQWRCPKSCSGKRIELCKTGSFFSENGSFPKQNMDHYHSSQQPPNETPQCFKNACLMHLRPLNTSMKTRVTAAWRCLRWSELQWRLSNNEVIHSVSILLGAHTAAFLLQGWEQCQSS